MRKNKINTRRETRWKCYRGVENWRHLWDAHLEKEIYTKKIKVTRICALQMYLSSSLGLHRPFLYLPGFFSYNSPLAPALSRPPPSPSLHQAFKLMKRKIPEHSKSKVFFLLRHHPPTIHRQTLAADFRLYFFADFLWKA